MGFSFYNRCKTITMEKKFDLRDIAIIPTIQSDISSRKECSIKRPWEFGEREMLPLLASPMDTVVCEKNYSTYIDHGIIPCLPRGFAKKHLVNTPFYFQAFGLCEIEQALDYYKSHLKDPSLGLSIMLDETKDEFYHYPNILIDIANGHMAKLIPIIQDIKKYWPKIKLMVGNVANPLTYKNLSMAGADFVRCSIGSGAGCTTAANVAINYPLGSLISECHKLKTECHLSAKIVADGGMQGYDDIIKALALGADYVMIGSLFNKAMQSAGYNYLWGVKIESYNIAKTLWKWGFPVKKKYRGMSTKAVQRSWGKTKLVTAEGITKYQKIEYNLSQWVENFQDYLRSNMSYCGARNLEEFIGETEYVFITELARKRFEK
jgi:IMP dehydrogenase/GMP reductase